jgi:hypothetical protein
MAETPIIDAAIRAGCVSGKANCRWPECRNCETHPTAAFVVLRAALPWDLPAERLEAMARAIWGRADSYHVRMILDAYRADPIMRELYPERFR